MPYGAEGTVIDLMMFPQSVLALALAVERFILVVRAAEAKTMLTKRRRILFYSFVGLVSFDAPLIKALVITMVAQNASGSNTLSKITLTKFLRSFFTVAKFPSGKLGRFGIAKNPK